MREKLEIFLKEEEINGSVDAVQAFQSESEKILDKMTQNQRRIILATCLMFGSVFGQVEKIESATSFNLNARGLDDCSGFSEHSVSTEDLASALIKKCEQNDADISISLKEYATASKIQSETMPLKSEVIKKVVDEYIVYKERWETVLPEYNPNEYVVDVVADEIQSELDGLLGKNVNGIDYAMTMSVLETSALPVLQGRSVDRLGIDDAQKAWQIYQKSKSAKVLAQYNRSIESILTQSIDPHGYVGTYRFGYATVIDVAQFLGFEVQENQEGSQIKNELQKKIVVKDVKQLKQKVRKKVEKGIKNGDSEEKILDSLAELDLRFDNQMATLMTQAVPVWASRLVEEKFPGKLSEEELTVLLPLAHKKGMYGFLDSVGKYLKAREKKGLTVDQFLKRFNLADQNYIRKARGILSLAALNKDVEIDTL